MPTPLILFFLLGCDPVASCEDVCFEQYDACAPVQSQYCEQVCARASDKAIDAYLTCAADAHAPEDGWDDVSCSDAAICAQPLFTDL